MHEELKREARPYRPPTFNHIYTQAWRPGLRKNRPFGPQRAKHVPAYVVETVES